MFDEAGYLAKFPAAGRGARRAAARQLLKACHHAFTVTHGVSAEAFPFDALVDAVDVLVVEAVGLESSRHLPTPRRPT